MGCAIGIGMCVPGLIDFEKGVVIAASSFPKWKNVPLVELLAEKLGTRNFRRCFVQNLPAVAVVSTKMSRLNKEI